MEQEVSQEYTEDDLEMVSIKSVCFNKRQSLVTAKLEMCIGSNNMIIPYKKDTGSDGNIMPRYIFKKFFPGVTESQLMKIVKYHIKLKMYNKTMITHLGACVVIVAYKINRRKCEFFVVLGNGQALFDMPDTAAHN